MKTKLLKHFSLRATMLVLMVLAAVNGAWAESSIGSVKYTVASTSSVTSDKTIDGVTASFKNTYTTKDQMTNGNSMTLSLTDFPYKVTSVVLSLHRNSSKGSGTATVKVNNSEFAKKTYAQGDLTASYQDYTLTGTATTGDVEIVLTSTANSFYCQYFVINYEEEVIDPITSDPSISVNPASITLDAAEHDGTITVSYNKIDTEVGANVYFYESDGETAASYDWITAEIDEDFNVSYLVETNTGEARTAYLKVYGLDEDANDIYSKLITIKQNKKTFDYADLPFSFNGGQSEISSTTGLSQKGISTTDYKSENSKLKFDSSDDYLILKIDETPGTLSFNIKGNSFSGGTFKVQSSADGTNYTDVETYTSISNDAEDEKTINSLPADTRYIKWIYTNKSGGNVGLGKINLEKFKAPITITSAGYATYCSESALDFTDTGIKAFVGTLDGTTLTFTPIVRVPAKTGILLFKDGGTTSAIEVPGTSSISSIANNCLTGVLAETTIGSNDYILNMKDGKPGFYPAGTHTALGAHKAYIPAAAGVKGFAIDLDGNETAIEVIKAMNGNAPVYNLAGQRVQKAQKGIFIQNGRKFIVK